MSNDNVTNIDQYNPAETSHTVTLRENIEVFHQTLGAKDEWQFIATICLNGSKFDENFEDGSVMQVGAFLWSKNFTKTYILSGLERYHPPLRARTINLLVADAKANGAKSLTVRDSGLHESLKYLLAARKRNGLNADGKPLKGFEELDQVQRYIDEGFLKLDWLRFARKKKSPDRVIAKMLAKREVMVEVDD